MRININEHQLVVSLRASEDIMKKVISLPHGWGSISTGGNNELKKKEGSKSFNDLTHCDHYDPLSGMSTLNGFIVKVSKYN